jgi:hypothetical protein
MNGVDRDDLAFALDQLGRDRQPVTQNTLGFALKQIKERRQAAAGIAAPGAVVDRKQQATDDMFERAYQRAVAREEAG